MKYKLKITDEHNDEYLYDLVSSSPDELKNLNDFILEFLSISEDKRQLPLLIRRRNRSIVTPLIKIKFKDGDNLLFGDEPEAMMLT